MADGAHTLFAIGQRGVAPSITPVHMDEAELVTAQNIEINVTDAIGAVDKRPGMSLINNGGVLGATIVSIHDVPPTLQTDLTPHLYVSVTGGVGGSNANNFRTSTDGTNWSNAPAGANPALVNGGSATPMNSFSDLVYAKAMPRLVTVGNKLFYIGQPTISGTTPMGLWSFDGTNATYLAAVPPGVVGTALNTPDAPNPVVQGATGSTNYSYKVVARFGSAHSAASTAGSNAFGPAVLNSSNYFAITPVSPPVASATSYDVYRTVGGATQGLVGTIPIVNGAFTFGNGSGNTNFIFTDQGLTGDGSTAPNTGTGTSSVNPVAYGDIITDGTLLYLAVVDVTATVSGRLLSFDPVAVAWNTVGSTAIFPNSNGNGTPDALANYDGAITYGTYPNTPVAGITTYVTTSGQPLAAGGAIDVHTFAASYIATQMIVFQGQLYVATLWSGAGGTAAAIFQRLASATWANVKTGPGTVSQNAFTSLGIYNGRLFAGWSSGDGSSAAQIFSTVDGVTWTSDFTGLATEVVGNMQVFNTPGVGNELYVVMAKTFQAGNTTSRVIKRSVSGTWTTQDQAGGVVYTGGIGIAYF